MNLAVAIRNEGCRMLASVQDTRGVSLFSVAFQPEQYVPGEEPFASNGLNAFCTLDGQKKRGPEMRRVFCI